MISAAGARSPPSALPAVAFLRRSRRPPVNVADYLGRESQLFVSTYVVDPMINEANESSSACRLWRISQVETSTPPASKQIIAGQRLEVKLATTGGAARGSQGR
jgi:hypothetical protein